MTVADLQVAADGVLELAGAAVRAAPKLFLGQRREHRSTRLSHEAPVGVKCRWKRGSRNSQRWIAGVFVGGVVIDDQMQLGRGRHRLVDGLKELAKLDCPMPLMQLADHGASFEVERREQVGRAVPQIVRRAPLGLAGTHRQHWLAAVERLNLRLFIHAQDQARGRAG